MRPSVLVGILLIIAGVVVYFRGVTTKEKVLDVGPLEVSSEERHPVSPWLAGVIVVAGIALVTTGARRRA